MFCVKMKKCNVKNNNENEVFCGELNDKKLYSVNRMKICGMKS